MKSHRRYRKSGPRYSVGDVWTVKETPWLAEDERVVIISVDNIKTRGAVRVSSAKGEGDIPVKKLKKKISHL